MNKTLLFCLISASFSAQAANLLPTRGNDQSATRVVSAALPSGDFERKPVSFNWQLDPAAELAAPAPFMAESREYWAQVDASELARGYDIDTTAPGAVIRISPARGATPVAMDKVQVLRNGRAIAQPESFQRQADAKQLQAAGMDISEGSAVLQLAEGNGQGRFQLKLAKASGRYLVHVFEPNSPYTLKAQAARSTLLAGDTLEVNANLGNGQKALGGQMDGMLVSPSGRTVNMTFSAGRGRVQVPMDAASERGLWEVQLFAGTIDKGASIQRDARTAIAIAQPTAKLAGSYQFDAAALRFSLPVQVGAEGRYELRGTLYATAPDGIARPVSQSHSAAWLVPGSRSLSLSFDRSHVPLGYSAPFEMRNLELNDQTRMGKLETRELAAREGKAR